MEDLIGIQELVAGAVVGAQDLADAYASGLAALAEGLGWQFAAAWEPGGEDGALSCVAHWTAIEDPPVAAFSRETVALQLPPGSGLPGRVWRLGAAVRVDDIELDSELPRRGAALAAGLRHAVAFPLRSERGIAGVVEAFGDTPLPRGGILRSLEVVGVALGLIVERRRSEGTLDVAERRHRATLEAALDCIVTMDHHGNVIEFNPAAQRTFGYSHPEVVGREMAELIVPPDRRSAHRSGLRRYLESGVTTVLDRRIEIEAMRADGSLLPVELAITRIDVPGPPVFTAHIRDITSRLAAEAELKASRRRIVDAADASRRQIERDLHDGAQQRLVSAALNLRLAHGVLDSNPDQAREILLESERELNDALAELRELARGIHPAILTEGGLAAAITSLTRRSTVPARLLHVPTERLPAGTEATIYFVVAEGLTNIARHASASRAEIAVTRAHDWLTVRIVDDGVGGADPAGSGLRGLEDRLVTLGGSLHIESPPGAGTTLTAKVPCES
jgi:PAS domain S-box-containing protein